jgi:hypothetical protein
MEKATGRGAKSRCIPYGVTSTVERGLHRAVAVQRRSIKAHPPIPRERGKDGLLELFGGASVGRPYSALLSPLLPDIPLVERRQRIKALLVNGVELRLCFLKGFLGLRQLGAL